MNKLLPEIEGFEKLVDEFLSTRGRLDEITEALKAARTPSPDEYPKTKRNCIVKYFFKGTRGRISVTHSLTPVIRVGRPEPAGLGPPHGEGDDQ